MSTRIFLTYILFFLFGLKAIAQPKPEMNTANLDTLRAYEMRLKALSDSLLDGSKPRIRAEAHRKFIPLLKKALKVPGSFDYPFDSLVFMKKLVPEDRSFRMFNWTLKFEDGTFHYVAAIQMNTKDSLKLIPLYDKSAKMDTSLDEAILDPEHWFGALYYTIFDCKVKGKKYYMLIGWNGFNQYSDEKVIEVLSFDKNGKVQLGAPIFEREGKIKTRVVFTYGGDATMLLNYLPDQKIISFDHLVPASPASAGKTFLYVPDGTYDYFVLKKGKWKYQDDLFEHVKGNIKEAGE